MKRLLTITTLLFLSLNCLSQSCLPEGIDFHSQAEIDNFQINYPDCSEIEGDVTISDYELDITNLIGLSMLTHIGGNLKIGRIFFMDDLTGLDNLVYVNGNIEIGYSDNFMLHSTDIYSLSGLDNLESVGGKLSLFVNYNLSSLSGLNKLSSVGGELYISGNYSLTSLNGLESLSSIGGNLGITYNDSLLTLSGLDNIDASSINNLNIYGNYFLSECEVQSVCNYLASPNGIVNIHDNSSDCSSQEEVEATCGVSVDEIPLAKNQIKIYPNPSFSTITIEAINPNIYSMLSIFNLNGQELIKQWITQPITCVEINHLPVGVYCIRLTSENETLMFKVIKY